MLAWFTEEKLVILVIGILGSIAASFQEWSTVGVVIAVGGTYLKGVKRD